jgi:hypothetical protein
MVGGKMNNPWNLLMLSIVLISACGDNTASLRYKEMGNFLSGILEEGEYIDSSRAIKIGKTQSLEYLDWELLSCQEAEVRLEEYWQNTKTDSILLQWNGEARGYVDQHQQLKITAGRLYRIKVILPDGNEMTAETTVPRHIEVPGDSLTATEPAFGDYPSDGEWLELALENANQQHPLQVAVNDDAEFNLYLEFYCLEEYQNAEYTYPPGDNDFPVDENEYMGDSRQYPRRNISYYMYQPENGIVNINSYQSSILFYGRTQIGVYSIDSNYLQYLYKSDGYTAGGVVGGIGIFGSSTGKMLYSRVIK